MAPILVPLYLCALLMLQSCNPFAPTFDDTLVDRSKLLGDRKTIKGFFDYFRNTYEIRDSTLYGRMLNRGFIFQWYDFSTGRNIYWGRDQEMLSTYKMFTNRSVKSVTLSWGDDYVLADTLTGDTVARVERFFELTLLIEDGNDQTSLKSFGRANMTLNRLNRQSDWKISYWIDKYNY